jgi:hypothetical protein
MFSTGQIVISRVDAQGLTKGAPYKVVEVDSRPGFLGTFTDYLLEGEDGQQHWVGNGHIVLDAGPEPTVSITWNPKADRESGQPTVHHHLSLPTGNAVGEAWRVSTLGCAACEHAATAVAR